MQRMLHNMPAARDPEKILPTDRQKGESTKAYDAFLVYLNLGETRSALKVAAEIHKNVIMIRTWSARWNWVSRVIEWEDRVRQERILKFKDSRMEMFERHAKIGESFLEKLSGIIQKIDPESCSVADLCIALKTAVAVEREARGADDVGEDARAGFIVQITPAAPPAKAEENV